MPSKSAKKDKHVIFEKETPIVSPQEDFSESKPSAIENIISVVLGLAVVFVIGAMIVNVIRNRTSGPATNTDAGKQEEQLAATVSATYTVQAGDTLWSIAEKFFNDGFKYPEIQKANNMTADSHLDKGMQIFIPKIAGVDNGPTGPTGVEETVTTPVATGNATPEATNSPVAKATEAVKPSNTETPKPSVTVVPTPTVMVLGPTGATGTNSEVQQGQTSSASTDKQYTVVKGDNLWTISMKRYNDGYKWVEIARMNNLKNPDVIHPGNVLLMP